MKKTKSKATQPKSQTEQISEVNVPTTETTATTTGETNATPMMAEVAPTENPEASPPAASEDTEVVQAPSNDEPTGTEIVVPEVFIEMLDVTVQEPTNPALGWQGPADPPLVLPSDKASNEELIDGARQLVQTVQWRMRRTVQEWWLIGHHLNLLKARPENEGRWRTEILPAIGINHTTDHQLRTLSERVAFERCLDFRSKTEALKSIGFFASPQPKQLCASQTDVVWSNDAKLQNGIEDILGIDGETTLDFEIGGDGLLSQATPFDLDSEGPLTQAAPFEEPEVQDEVVAEPHAVAAEASEPDVKGEAQSQPVPEKKAKADAVTKKIAAKVTPETKPEGDDPIDGTEALIVVLEGAKAADTESLLAQSGFSLLAKSQDRVVGGLWYGRESNKAARAMVHEALAKLRAGKEKIKIEANYLELSEVIPV